MVNGKQYVGQTTRTLEERWREHCSSHSKCIALYADIDKYGKENFRVEQLDIGVDQFDLDYKESMWIECLHTMSPNGYNLKNGGSHGKHSEEVKEKMRQYWATHERTDKQKLSAFLLGKFNKGKSHTKEHKEKIDLAKEKQVDQFDLAGNLIATWRSLKDAANMLHIPRGNICKVCRGERLTAHGYIWKYHEEQEVVNNVAE